MRDTASRCVNEISGLSINFKLIARCHMSSTTLDEYKFNRRCVLRDCFEASNRLEPVIIKSPRPDHIAFVKELEAQGSIIVGRDPRKLGSDIIIHGFTEKGKKTYCPNGKLLQLYKTFGE